MVGGYSDINVIKTFPKLINVHVSGHHPETTPEDLQSELNEQFPEVKCESLKSKRLDLHSSLILIINRNNFKSA